MQEVNRVLPHLRLAKAAEDAAQCLLRLMRGAVQRGQHLLSAALEVLVEEEEADAAGSIVPLSGSLKLPCH